uniref:hypothetical protein n=1 Tax=Sulfitobacter pontiacus TaxID=60137 RepID=UPI0030EB8A2D
PRQHYAVATVAEYCSAVHTNLVGHLLDHQQTITYKVYGASFIGGMQPVQIWAVALIWAYTDKNWTD